MNASTKMKVRQENRVIDPLIRFKRISILKKTDAQLKRYLQYELAPYTLAFFDDNGMRKTTKSSLYKIFPETETSYYKNNALHVVDGGFLLRKIPWEQGENYGVVCRQYVSYVERHFDRMCFIVVDGYSKTNQSTKSAEQNRRYKTLASLPSESFSIFVFAASTSGLTFTDDDSPTLRVTEFL